MIKEYIERELAIGAVEYIACRDPRVFSSGAKYGEIIQTIQEVPAADVAPVVHAYWTGRLPEDNAMAEGFANWFTDEDKKAYIENEKHRTHCSNCKGGYDDREVFCIEYCHFCGAKMDGGNSND